MINRWGHGEEGKKNKHINVGGGDNSCRKPHAMQAPGSQLADRTGHAKITADAILPAMINSRRSRCRRRQEIAISRSWERLDKVATWWIAVGGGTNLVEEVKRWWRQRLGDKSLPVVKPLASWARQLAVGTGVAVMGGGHGELPREIGEGGGGHQGSGREEYFIH